MMWSRRKGRKAQGHSIGTYHCPRCNSTNIEQELAITAYVLVGYSLLYHCHDCGYKGLVVHNDFNGELDERGPDQDPVEQAPDPSSER